MLSVTVDEDNLIVILEPETPLSEVDFHTAAEVVDPVIEKHGQLNGLIVCTPSFHGWESFGALISHLRFVKNHHRDIARVAFVTDSFVGDIVRRVASHFVNAEIRSFPYDSHDVARRWVARANGA
ncbi:SpoIIAA-like [Marinobacter daqiaonensis]|uniref:SpoIIAA-like n=1 Tax=Marinobacter daqiaonensis TaxID=650891 RepID=A0A1I6GYP3_9GAMM|nr:STAS/SEC14 domain-containing protein [Marinobacter daqiaonensis]SFR47239.1 SpoIIAA-like [Marinobacter daqiaonensis]